jgi:hypothetical protein
VLFAGRRRNFLASLYANTNLDIETMAMRPKRER